LPFKTKCFFSFDVYPTFIPGTTTFSIHSIGIKCKSNKTNINNFIIFLMNLPGAPAGRMDDIALILEMSH
jgi:hypothetical protein